MFRVTDNVIDYDWGTIVNTARLSCHYCNSIWMNNSRVVGSYCMPKNNCYLTIKRNKHMSSPEETLMAYTRFHRKHSSSTCLNGVSVTPMWWHFDLDVLSFCNINLAIVTNVKHLCNSTWLGIWLWGSRVPKQWGVWGRTKKLPWFYL